MGQLRKATDFWSGLAGPSRRLLIAAVAIFLVGVFVLMRLSGQVEYATVASKVPTDQVAAIQQELDNAGIPNRTADGASAIQVPAQRIDEARIALAGSAAGRSPGLEIFDTSSFGETDYTQQIKFLRAKQGEVARTLASLDAVESANVQIAFPERKVFSAEQQPTTASVVLSLVPGQTLNPEQVGVVTALVAKAVPNLDAKNVTVTDTRGNVLESNTGSGVASASNRMEVEAAHQRRVQAQIEGLLTGILGPGKAVVAYNATLNLDKTNVESETYNRQSAVPLEQSRTTERMRSTNGRPGNVAGATANAPGNTFPAGNNNGGNTNYDRTQNQVKNGVDRERRSSEVAGGDVVRQSIAVSVSDTVPAAMVPQIENQVARAVGLVENRDQISVERVPFAEDSPVVTAASEAGEPEAAGEALSPAFTPMNIIKTVAAVLGALAVLFFARRALRRRQSGLESILPELLEEGPVPVAALTAPPQETKQLEGMVKTPVEKQMEDLAMRKPDDMAKLIRGWLAQR